MTEMDNHMTSNRNEETMLFVRMGSRNKEKSKSGLIPLRLFAEESQCDFWTQHHPSPWGSYVKFSVMTEQCNEGVRLYMFNPTGGKHEEYGILSHGLYAQLRNGTAPTPESEKN